MFWVSSLINLKTSICDKYPGVLLFLSLLYLILSLLTLQSHAAGHLLGNCGLFTKECILVPVQVVLQDTTAPPSCKLKTIYYAIFQHDNRFPEMHCPMIGAPLYVFNTQY